MEDELFKYTEKVIIAARHGEIEQKKILEELESLLVNKPDNVSDEMVKYLQFLILVVKGENTDELFNQLEKNLQELFGKVIEKFKGTDIFKTIKELTRKSIIASRGTQEQKEEILKELLTIKESKPEGGSNSISHYVSFLIDVVKGADKAGAINSLDENLANIFTSELKEIFEPNMMKFFMTLTEMAFKASKTSDNKDKALDSINELLTGQGEPPLEIKKYLELLRAVVDGTYHMGMKEVIGEEFLDIFNEVENNQ